MDKKSWSERNPKLYAVLDLCLACGMVIVNLGDEHL